MVIFDCLRARGHITAVHARHRPPFRPMGRRAYRRIASGIDVTVGDMSVGASRPPGWVAGQADTISTGRCLTGRLRRRRRRRHRWRAGPARSGHGHTASWCVDQREDENWLSRYNAVAALRRRNDTASRPCIERALGDLNLVVRAEAIKAISRWDANRALSLYQQLLDAEGLTPLLRSEAHAALGDLRAGLPVREPWDR